MSELLTHASPPSTEDIPGQLARDLRALPAGRTNAPGAIHRNYDTTLHIAARWLSLVDIRRHAARASPSDQKRWNAYTTAVKQAPTRHPDQQSLIVLLGTVRDMLKDLRATEPPCPTVADVTTRIRNMIAADPVAYPPGASLPRKDLLARKCGVPEGNVELALGDLRAEGVVDRNPGGSARVRARGPYRARQPDIDGWLRTLIRTGVYPPGRPLPSYRELARTLAIGEDPVRDVTARLGTQGVLHLFRGQPPVVLPDTEAQPFDLAAVLLPLEHLPQPGGGRPVLEATARRTRSSWVARVSPPAPQLEEDIGVLRADAVHLAPLVHGLYPDAADVVARAAVTAAEPLPADGHQRLWRAACLAIAVQDLLSELTVRSL
ncbi:GntR family transcriptional regulator [Streptomyces sp. NPDC050428]|uniref:GntR family transcriptional regulator n=1 Tax=Streptomyces sp. NPDC050428 TaxID=3155757 RepID=UPI0034288C61